MLNPSRRNQVHPLLLFVDGIKRVQKMKFGESFLFGCNKGICYIDYMDLTTPCMILHMYTYTIP